MQVTTDTPRASRTIAGITVTVPQPYAEGHQCTAAEASMLNQTVAENFSNNLRKRVEEYKESEDAQPRLASPEEAQAIVDAYAAAYEPGVRQGGGGGGRSLTPLEKEVRDLARSKVAEHLRSKGLKRADVEFSDLVARLIEKRRDQLEAAAQKVLNAKEKAAQATAGSDDDLLAEIIPEQQEAAE